MKSVKELNSAIDKATKAVRKTVDAIVDELSFVESDKFILSATSFGDATGEGVVSGFATVADVQVGIFAINGEVLKGGIGAANASKIAKCVDNAVKTGSPVIGIVNTSGARFAEGIEAMEGYGAIVSAFAAAQGNVPTILVVKGNNFGMLTYLSGIVDVTICCDKSVMATSSPLILAANSTTDIAKVGTPSAMAEGGVASIVVKNDNELAVAVKNLISIFCEGVIASTDDGNRVCKGLTAKTSTAKLIAEVFDSGSFIEIKKDYGKEVTVGYARLNGIAVGIVANNGDVNEGRFTPEAANKISEFICTCDNFGLPIVNIVDSKGVANCLCCQGKLMSGVGEVMYGYNCASVAKVSLVRGNAIGAAYVAMASKSAMDYVIAWENACIGMLDNVASAELVYADQIKASGNDKKVVAKLAEAYGEENTAAVVVAQKGYIDNVIAPNLSRQYLIAAVQAFIEKR